MVLGLTGWVLEAPGHGFGGPKTWRPQGMVLMLPVCAFDAPRACFVVFQGSFGGFDEVFANGNLF